MRQHDPGEEIIMRADNMSSYLLTANLSTIHKYLDISTLVLKPEQLHVIDVFNLLDE